MAQAGKRDLDEVVARARLLEDGSKQHEQENQRGRDTERDAEDTLALHPEMPCRLVEGCPLPLHHLGQPAGITEENVTDEDRRHEHQGQAQRTIDGACQDQHTNRGNHQIIGGRQAGAQGNRLAENHRVQRNHDAERDDYPVIPGNSVTRAVLEQRECHRRQHQRKGEVDTPGVGIGDDGPFQPGVFGQPERKVRCDVKLEHRPDESDNEDDFSKYARRVACPGVGLGYQISSGVCFEALG